MKIDNFVFPDNWRHVLSAARNTVGLDVSNKEPNYNWKRRMLLAEHSPIRLLNFSWVWRGLPSWVSVHFVRHKNGIEHFVQSQRDDRQDLYHRDSARQDAKVNHMASANVQALINISRKRLCNQASEETRDAWYDVVYEIQQIMPEVAEVLVPDCIYRGWCFEMKSCGYHLTDEYKRNLHIYRSNINGWSE